MNFKENDVIQLDKKMSGEFFNNKYNGIPEGTKGTIYKIQQTSNIEWVLSVKWENNRTLNVLYPIDHISKVKLTKGD
jgi:hypothetical protein